MRRDGKPASLTELSAVQAVQLYYKLEMGQHVATEVTWKAAQKTGESKPKA